MDHRFGKSRGGQAAMKALGMAVLGLALLSPRPGLSSALDADLRAAMASLARGEDMGTTLNLLEQSSRNAPDLSAAHLLRSDIYGLLAGLPKTQGISRADGPADMSTRFSRLRPSADVETLRDELRARAAWLGRPEGALPLNVLALEPGIEHVVLVDLSAPRVFLLARHGESLKVSAEYYGSVGLERGPKSREGDFRTPVGAYRIQGELRGSALRPYHGPLALVLDYPNAADRRAGRTGSHIWIHGVPPDVAARPPFSTEGCVALANSDLLSLRRALRLDRTKVVIVERTEWVPEAAWRSARAEALAAAPRSTLVSLGPTTPIMGMRRNGEISLAVAPAISAETLVGNDFASSGAEASPLSASADMERLNSASGPARTEPRPRSAPATTQQTRSRSVVPGRSVAAINPATIRREPRGEAIGTIARGETLDVLMEAPGGWVYVQTAGRKGFVHAMNLSGLQ